MDEITKSIQEARASQRLHIGNSFSNFQEVTADETAIAKAREIDENPFNKAAEEADLEKARAGVYGDTAQNRKLGRVGQKYGAEGKQEEGGEKKTATLGESDVKEIVDKMRKNGFHQGRTRKNVFTDRDGNRQLTVKNDGSVRWSEIGDDNKRTSKTFGSVDEALKRRWLDDEVETKKAKTNDLEKSDIMEAISRDDNVKISKTGKEIKEQIETVCLPEMMARLATKEAEATAKLSDCGNAPTQDPDKWWTDGIQMNCGFKVYGWEETCAPTVNSFASSMDVERPSGAGEKCANDPEEAQCRREYNDLVRAICNIKVDIKCCEYLKSIKDTQEFALNPRQLAVLKF